MKVLIIGSGGREHALAAALSKDSHQVYVAPGNAGIAREFVCLDMRKINEVVQWCRENRPGFVLIGPEQQLAEGWADILNSEGIPCVGPSQAQPGLKAAKLLPRT